MTESPRVAICPGSFDPLTLGHEDIIRRALGLADRVVIAVSHSPSQIKRQLFDVDQRIEMIQEVFADEGRVKVLPFQGLLVDFARKQGATIVVRGLRGVKDFEYEFQMALMNRRLDVSMETVFLAPEPEYAFVSSTLIREISALGGSVDQFLSPSVARRVAAVAR